MNLKFLKYFFIILDYHPKGHSTRAKKGGLRSRVNGPHFTEIIDRGKMYTMYVYLVMELVGKSLSDIKDLLPGKVLSIGSGIFAVRQCLEAIEDLHAVIHSSRHKAGQLCGWHWPED